MSLSQESGLVFADDEGVLRWIDVDDVERHGRGDPEAAALADRVADEASVPADLAPGSIVDRARRDVLIAEQERDVFAVSETEVLALRQGGCGQPGLAREREHVALPQLADWQQESAEGVLAEPVEEVGLILARVYAAEESNPFSSFVRRA